ncbi:MAG: 4Fe-4S binding protein [Desulfovibrio sp.]|nr:4Fe-4S binding protein [Desulfovibrio sp.]
MSEEHGYTRVISYIQQRIHRGVQSFFLVYMLYVGISFAFYAFWAMGESSQYAPRFPSVEAFLPISAMLAAKRFCLTGHWDPVHPAGLVIFFLALFLAFFLRKSFCGYLCPVGAIEDMLFRAGKRLGFRFTPPVWVLRIMSAPKYILLAFFLFLPISMGLPEIEDFLLSRYNLVCDTKMLLFFLEPGPILLSVLALLAVGSLFFPSFWCRAFCPYGALLGLFSWCSPLYVKREEARCVHCGRCTSACPQGIDVMATGTVRVAECTGCMECVKACPAPDCLSPRALGRRLSPLFVPLATLCILFLCYTAAELSGHWQTALPPEMVRVLHKDIRSLGHH